MTGSFGGGPAGVGSVGEVRQVLAEVSAGLSAAYQHASAARERIAEAAEVLTGLDRLHHEEMVPPELGRADRELERGLVAISSGVESVAAVAARL